jgi:hypothetical protein
MVYRIVIVLLAVLSGCVFADTLGNKEPLSNDAVLAKLRGSVRELLVEVESQSGVEIKFESLGKDSVVVAAYQFWSPDRAIVKLRDGWGDADVAHELIHMQLELGKGYSVLAWRREAEKSKSAEAAIGLVRSYVDDMLVFEGLLGMGLELDGEIIRRQFFDDICTNIPRYLREGRTLKDDGMAHLDNIDGGKYSGLRRVTFLVQAELFKSFYGDRLSDERNKLLDDFISAFRQYRKEQAKKGDRVLALFKKHDIHKKKGHDKILKKWAAMEELDVYVGLSSYVHSDDGFVLPFPEK